VAPPILLHRRATLKASKVVGVTRTDFCSRIDWEPILGMVRPAVGRGMGSAAALQAACHAWLHTCASVRQARVGTGRDGRITSAEGLECQGEEEEGGCGHSRLAESG
jgi:hypothetical protein